MDKVAHFYWGGRPLPFINALTLRSFRKTNPDWKIILWTCHEAHTEPTWGSGEQAEVAQLADFWEYGVEHVDEVRLASFPGDIAARHDAPKSDYLLLQAMYDQGGAYFDMDILFFRPIDFGCQAPMHAIRTPTWQVAFVACEKELPIIGQMRAAAQGAADCNYQTIGRFLWERHEAELLRSVPDIHFIHHNAILPFDWQSIRQIFELDCPVPAESWGVHWFNGSPHTRPWLTRIGPGNYRNYNNTFSRICRENAL